MCVGYERTVGNASAGVGGHWIRPVGINEGRLDERQGDSFTGLPAGAGDGDGGTWGVIGLIGFYGGETVKLGAREGVWRRGGVFAARDQEQSILLQRAASSIAASWCKRAGRRKSSLPGSEQFGRSDGRADGCSAHDEDVVVVREEEREMAMASGSKRAGDGRESSGSGIEDF